MRSVTFLKNTSGKISLFVLALIAFGNIEAQKDTTSVLKHKNHLQYSLTELREQIDDAANDPNFANAYWGIMIKSLKSGETIYKRNADKLMMPASDMKLFTTATALLLLGSDYRYNTKIYLDGTIEKTKIKGDLIIRGSGDPTISSRFFEGKSTKVFEDFADTLIKKGIKRITGNIIGDDNAFDQVGLGKGWSWDYESSWFSAPSGALSFNDNSVDIFIKPSVENMPALISIEPDTKYVTIINKVITVADTTAEEINIIRNRGTNIITVFGKIHKHNKGITEFASINDPTLYTVSVLKEVLEQKGITVDGYATDLNDESKEVFYDDLLVIYDHKSVPLRNIVKEINKNSNNFYAEQLLKTLGLELYNFGSIDNGVKGCRDIFNVMGINPDNMVIADGSGLSRLNLVTPKQIVNLLSYMYKSDEFSTFYNSLPVAGTDGTLANRMKKTSAENNVHAKPGYNTGVTSLSGYVRTLSGEPLAFSLIVNNYLVPSNLANYIQDMICQRLANFSRN